MKKHRTNVPDFSRKQQPSRREPEAEGEKLIAPVHRPAPLVKPRATSAKSGRRGQ
ncbi:MAG: hypothetical protein WBQ26_09005 [Gemmatimonadaceae bacterium]|nr:hypothetical protein [Gemmatimonadaceae bacterium]